MAATTIDIKDPDTEARPEGQRPIKSGRDSWPFSLFLRGGDDFFHFFSDSCQMLGIILIESLVDGPIWIMMLRIFRTP